MYRFEVGDIVEYHPPYPVEGVWLERIGTEYHVVKVPVNSNFGTMLVAKMDFIGLCEDEIPRSAVYRLSTEAFKKVGDAMREPKWEV